LHELCCFTSFYNSGLVQFHNDALVLMTISLLIIMGGLGFTVISDLITNRFRMRRTTLHTRMVVVTTLILLAGGMLYFGLAEWNNPRTLGYGDAKTGEKLLNAWFQSVTPRTAGFFSFDQGALSDASKLVTIVLMLVGASPASTGGGIKTSTVAVIATILSSVIAGKQDYEVSGRRLPGSVARTALSILVVYLVLVLFGGVFLSLVEQGRFSMIDLLYEEASALGTVGLTALGTANLKAPSQLFLIVLMYFGRVGPLTMMLTMGSTSGHPGTIHYPEEGVLLG
jgi:trk system potassium uptake protein TrkH